jgi:peptidoglycan hydrolase-like amidase
MPAITIAAAVHIGVFGLFHPVQFDVRPAPGQVLMVETEGRTTTLEGSASTRLRSAAHVTGRDGREAVFVLSIPDKIRREFHGTLEIRRDGSHLEAIVEMNQEVAVASIVAAEGGDATPFEARKAQAVVARSFLTAGHGRHRDFDFCDTTHCQFLREPPLESSAAFRAAADTRGQVLMYDGHVIAALYSADCGGHTRALRDSDWRGAIDAAAYPYFAVECPVQDKVAGHRVGMCQVGAAEMARRGAGFHEILAHYFPATVMAESRSEGR